MNLLFPFTFPKNIYSGIACQSHSYQIMPFFKTGRTYVVLGASTAPYKFGNRILKWYISQKLPVVPINPRANTVCGLKAYQTLNAYIERSKGSDGDAISVSVVTPVEVSLELLKQVKNSNNGKYINSIWFQPGTYNSAILEYVRNDLGIDSEDIIAHGECILISGKRRLNEEQEH